MKKFVKICQNTGHSIARRFGHEGLTKTKLLNYIVKRALTLIWAAGGVYASETSETPQSLK
jgi:hypothetical protein